jgi:hypothetical protein
MIIEVSTPKEIPMGWYHGLSGVKSLEDARKVSGVVRGYWCKSNLTLFYVKG